MIGTAEVIIPGVTTAGLLVYIGLAVSVALFHPDTRQRRDARSVLTKLIRLRR
jgi:hypothetical protein